MRLDQDLTKNAETLLENIKQQVLDSIPDEAIWQLHGPLSEAANILLRTWNARRPLMRLPTETLNHILSLIPDCAEDNVSDFIPHWHSESMDSLMLVPISRTCHRLREVTLGNSLLWRHGYVKGRETTMPIFLERSQKSPLTLILSQQMASPNASQFLQSLQPADILRVRELHLYGMYGDALRDVLDVFQLNRWPILEHLTFSPRRHHFATQGTNLATLGNPAPLRLIPEHMPRLRYLHLQSVPAFPANGFPDLTHLSVSNTIIRDNKRHQLVEFVFACPNLESLFLGNFRLDWDTAPLWTTPIPPTALPRLRRVVLMDMRLDSVRFHLPMFALRDREDLAVQVLWQGQAPRMLPWEVILPQTSRGSSTLAISQHALSDRGPHDDPLMDKFPLLSVTAIGPKTTVRVAGDSLNLYAELHLVVSQHAFLAGVRDVWVDVAQQPAHTVVISALLAAAPALETITLITDYTRYRESGSPSFRLLPKRSERAVVVTRVRTLRLVHGYSDYGEGCRRWQESGEGDAGPTKLDLGKLLAGLESGEYDYFDELVLQTTSHLEVDEGAVDGLRAHVRVVRAERVEGLPQPPVPEYCAEPAISRHGTCAASMW